MQYYWHSSGLFTDVTYVEPSPKYSIPHWKHVLVLVLVVDVVLEIGVGKVVEIQYFGPDMALFLLTTWLLEYFK